MNAEKVREDYYNWMINKIYMPNYSILIDRLHDTEFVIVHYMDKNRASDGVSLRWRFTYENGLKDRSDEIDEILAGPCSILELLLGLAIRCESIMAKQDMEDRTATWFWYMIDNLYLSHMTNDKYDESYVAGRLADFLMLNYEPDGRGGLFYVDDPNIDMRDLEIWQQMMRFLNEFHRKGALHEI